MAVKLSFFLLAKLDLCNKFGPYYWRNVIDSYCAIFGLKSFFKNRLYSTLAITGSALQAFDFVAQQERNTNSLCRGSQLTFTYSNSKMEALKTLDVKYVQS